MIQAHDKHGYPVHPGDLLRTEHYRHRAGRMVYLYHVAVERGGECLVGVPASSLDRLADDGAFQLRDDSLRYSEIVQGNGPDRDEWFARVKKVVPLSAAERRRNMAEQSTAEGWPVTIGSHTISFDGFQFGGSISGMAAPYIEMAYRARRGDAVAAEILNSFMVTIYDANEKTYWPMDGSVKTPADRVATV